MVANQPDRARQLLDGLSISPLATLSCSEGFAWTSEDEFRAVRTILKSGFSPAARAEGRATQFLIEFINHLDHPAQFEPLMALLVDLSLPRGALQEAVTATGSLFGRSRMDPRSTQALYSPSISQRLRELLDETRKHELDGTAVLLEFVKYLRKAGSQTRCEDADGEARAAVFLSSFRRLWKDSFPNPESVDRIPESSELVSKEAKGKSDAEAYWKAGRDAEMATLLRKTWQQLDQPTVGLNTLNMAEKTELMQILLRRVEEWRGASKGEKRASSEFNKACLVYRELIERAPEDAIRATIAQEYVSFLSRNEMLAAEPVLWYLQVQLLIELEKKPSQTLLIQTAIRQEGHPLIRFRQLLCSGGACEREGDTKH